MAGESYGEAENGDGPAIAKKNPKVTAQKPGLFTAEVSRRYREKSLKAEITGIDEVVNSHLRAFTSAVRGRA